MRIKKRKKVAIAIVVLIMLLSFTSLKAETTGKTENSEAKITSIGSLKQLEESCEENNSQIALAKNKVIEMKNAVTDAEELHDDLVDYRKEMGFNLGGTHYTLPYQDDLVFALGEISATMQLDAAEINLEETRRSVLQQAYKSFYQAVEAQQNIALAEKSIEVAKMNYAIAELKEKLGMISTYDLRKAASDLATAQRAVTSSQNMLHNAVNSLNSISGLSLEDSFDFASVDEEIQIEKELMLVEDDVTKIALSFRQDYFLADGQHTLAFRKQGVAKSSPTSTTEEMRDADQSLASAITTKESLAQNIALMVSQSVSAVYAAHTNQLNAEEALEMARSTDMKADINYQKGNISKFALLQSSLAYGQAKAQKIKAGHDYKLAVLSLENTVGTTFINMNRIGNADSDRFKTPD